MAIRAESGTYLPGRGKLGRTKPKHKSKRPKNSKPTVVTRTSSGKITATGPGAGRAKKQTRESVKSEHRKINPKTGLPRLIGSTLHPGTTTKGSLADVARGAEDYVIHTPQRMLHGAEKEFKEGRASSPFPKGSAPDAAFQTAVLETGPGAANTLLKTASKTSEAATVAEGAKRALTKAAKGAKKAPARKLEAIKTAPKRAAKSVRETPKKVKTAPKRAKKAVSTSEGRKAIAKGGAKTAAKHPVRSAYAGSVVTPEGVLPGDVTKRARAFAQGHIEALEDNPKKTLESTAHAVEGIVTGPAALLGSAGASVIHGTPKPLEEEASKQAKGLKEIGEKLASGNPETVKKAVENEVGLSFVAPLPALSRLKKTEFYKGKRGAIREIVAAKREKTRGKRREELRAHKTGKQIKKPKKIKHAVIDTATGEERVLRKTGKVIEGHRQRKAEAKAAARAKAQGEREALLASKPIIDKIRRSKLTSRKARRRGFKEHDVADALATVVAYGISRKRDKMLKQLDDIEKSIGKINPDDLPDGVVTDLKNLQFLRQHEPDKPFWEAVDEYKRQAKEIETSKRKKVLAVSDVYGHARPEERLEAGVKVNGRTVATNFYKQKETLERKRAELGELRRDAKANRDLAETAAPQTRGKHAAIADEIQARAKKLERELKLYRKGYKQAQKEHYREAQATIRNKGYEQPAYVKDIKPREAGEVTPARGGGRPSVKQHMADVEQARRGATMARDFQTLIDQSVAEPRMRRAIHRSTTEFVDRWAVPVKGKRYVTSEEFSRAVHRGELDPRQYAKLHSQFFKQAILDPHKAGSQFAEEIGAALKGEIRGRAADTGNKYVVLPKEALQEFVHQMEPPKGMDKLFGGANRLLSRVILGYSPSWVVAQLVAEGIPAAISVGANPLRAARVAKFVLKEDKRLNRKDKAVLDGTVGESAGVTPHPVTQLKPDTHVNASHFFKLSERNKVGRALLRGATGNLLGDFNRWSGGKYRKAVAAAKADRELNGFFKSLSETMKGQRRISEAIKGKPLKAQMEYMARHPKEMARLESYLDNVMGNWRALTRHEAKIAPLVVFYPFVRYSLRWTFWSFPKEHPVKASILYFLSQQNAEELEKLAGGPLASPLDYTFPAYTTSKGQTAVLPGGTRIAPGMNALTESIGKKRIEGLVGAFNPAIGATVTGITGVDPFTGEKVATSPLEHGLLALNQILSLPTPARYPIKGESARERILGALGEKPPSDISKAFKGLNPNRDLNSGVFPFLPQSGARFKASEELSKALDQSGANHYELGDELVTAALEGVEKGDYKLAKELQRKREKGGKASDTISRIVSEYAKNPKGLPKLSDKQYEWLGRITGKRVFPYEPPKPNPFGLPDTGSESLREQFGLSTTSTSDLRKQFGFEE